MSRALVAIDLCCGLGGWARGFLDAGFDVIGFDVERLPYPGQLILQDVRTLDGRRFRGATVIVASPPCTEFSKCDQLGLFPDYREHRPSLELVKACFRIAREAGAPLILENVRGLQPFLGRSVARYGSRYLWGNGVPALFPEASRRHDKERGAHVARYRAKIPYPLARWCAECYSQQDAPQRTQTGASGPPVSREANPTSPDS